MTQKPVLYQDDVVRITNEQIFIFQYFFPLPMNKTIKMNDIKQVNLKTDLTKNQQYIQIIVKGFSVNATFSPSDPKKALQIIKARTCYNLAEGSIAVSKQQFKSQSKESSKKLPQKKQEYRPLKTDLSKKTQETKQNIQQGTQQLKKGAKQRKQDAQQKLQKGKQQIKKGVEQGKQQSKGIIQGVTGTIVHGWQELKQVSHNIYEAATQKISELTTPQTEQKAKQAKQNFKQGAQNLKQGAENVKQRAETKCEQGKQQIKKSVGMEPHKSTLENIKDSASHGWQNIVEGASNLMYKVADKVSEVTGTNVETQIPETKEKIKEQGQQSKQALIKQTQSLRLEKPLIQKTQQKAEQIVGTDAKKKAQQAKQHLKQGASDAGQSIKLATGYEGSKLQQAKQNFAQGWQNTKQTAKGVYDTTAQKVSEVGTNIQKKAGQKTKQAGQVLKEKGNKMQQNS